jgi:hypothetical protein
LTRTVVEGLHVDRNAAAVIVSARPKLGHPAVVAAHQPGTTEEPVGDVGELSMPAQLRCSSQPTPP